MLEEVTMRDSLAGPVHEQVCGGWTACDRKIVGRQTPTTLKAAEVTCPACREARRVAEAHMARAGA